jgi:hypothetical protein
MILSANLNEYEKEPPKRSSMIQFDANFAMLIWRDVPASVDKAKERVAHLVRELHEKRERILISTPVLTEILVHVRCSMAYRTWKRRQFLHRPVKRI